MSQGGISESQVRSIAQGIAQDVAQRAVAPIANQVDRLESQLANLTNRVSSLEEELSAIGNAIARMHSDVVSSLKSGFSSVSQEIDQQRQEVVGQTKRVETALEIGLAATTAATVVVGTCVDAVGGKVVTVGDKVDRGTVTAGELEYLRVFNEARAPLRQLEAFHLEIGERFDKSLESVGEERLRNDALFAKVHENLDRKMRTIGEHIFKIYEEDFAHAVAEPLTRTRLEHHEPALAVDDERMEARARALNTGLERAFQEIIEPLMEMQQRLEARLADEIAIANVGTGAFAIPATAVLTEGGLEVQVAPEAAPIVPFVKRSIGDPRTLSVRSIHQAEYEAIAHALRALTSRGVLGADDAETIIASIARDGFFVAAPENAGASR